MLTGSSYYEFSLAAGQAVSLLRTAGWEIVCVEGRVWLTEELGGEDVWLAGGQRHALTRPGRTVVEADVPTRLRLARPLALRRPAAWNRRPGRRSPCAVPISLRPA